MSGGPPWECPPERLASGRIVYRCNYGHMHINTTAAWSCDGPVHNSPISETGNER